MSSLIYHPVTLVRMRFLVVLVLLLLSLCAIPQTPAPRIHTFRSTRLVDTIFSGSAKAGDQGQPMAGVRLQMRSQIPASTKESSSRTVTLSGIALQITATPASCERANGTIVVKATGGTAPYQYKLDDGDWTYSPIFFIGGSTPYAISVMDAAGQVVSQSVTISNNYNAPVIYEASHVSASGCTSMDGSVTLTTLYGTPPYTYSMDEETWQSNPTFSGLPMGAYEFYVKDANGCTAYFIDFTNSCSGYGFANSAATCGSDGEINASIYPYTPNPPYTFSLDGVNYQSSGTFTGLAPGLYILHSKDASGKVFYFGWYIAHACYLTVEGTTQDAVCGGAGGSITATAANGTAPYLYSIDGINYQSGNTFSNLAAGSYTLVVKDFTGSLQGMPVTVGTNCPTVTAIPRPAYCTNNDGGITATAAGGTPLYTYSIDGTNFQASGNFTGLASGNYTVTVMDAGGFSGKTVVTIAVTPCLTVNLNGQPSTCGASNGQVSAAGTGGTPPYTYSIDGTNFQASGNFTGLMAGNYTISVKDANNLTASTPIVITDVPGPTVTWTMRPSDCNDQGGQLTINAISGKAPFQYSYVTGSWGSNNTFSLPAGNYQAMVMDAKGCITSVPATVSQACLHLTATGTDPGCKRSDGQIVAVASNGTAPYTYSIDGINFQSSPVFSALASGPYVITAKDAAGLANTAAVVLADLCISINLSAKDENCDQRNGSITVSASGSTAPYQYSLDGIDFQANNVFDALASGPKIVTVKDNRGNTATQSVSLANTAPPQATLVTMPASCRNDDGSIQITEAIGTAPYQFSIGGTAFVPAGSFGQVPSGTYTAAIEDAYGCITRLPAVVDLNNTVVVSGGPGPTICEGKSAVIPASSNGTSFSWQPATGLNNPSLLQPTASPTVTTTYTITAMDGACRQKKSVDVIVNPAPTANPGESTTVCYGASAQLQGAGGTTFAWTPTTYLNDPALPNPQVERPDRTTSYYLTVTDDNGCNSLNKASVTVMVIPPPKLFAGNDTSVFAGQPVPLDPLDVNGSGFTIFSWSPADGLSNPAIRNPVAVLPIGDVTYTLKAATDGGCEAIASITIKSYGVADIFVPSAFSPNGDGHNDLLRALPVGIREFNYFAVFSRWGQRVFYTTDASKGWDGLISGKTQEPGTYAWMAGGIDYSGKWVQRKGTVILVR